MGSFVFLLSSVYTVGNMKDGKAIERTQLSLSIGPTVQWNSL